MITYYFWEENKNEKSKVLATTTLAGALLFTGVGATHNAHAADYVNDSNVRDYAKMLLVQNILKRVLYQLEDMVVALLIKTME